MQIKEGRKEDKSKARKEIKEDKSKARKVGRRMNGEKKQREKKDIEKNIEKMHTKFEC